MKLREKRLIILWVVIALVSIFLGLRYEKTEDKSGDIPSYMLSEAAFLYGYPIAYNSIFLYRGQTVSNQSYNWRLITLPKYKYQLIVATILIGFALAMSVKGKP